VELKQQLRMSQQLVMTPQLQQAIKLLQMSRMELIDTVREELLENPILEDHGEVGITTTSTDARLAGGDDSRSDSSTIDRAIAADDRAVSTCASEPGAIPALGGHESGWSSSLV
jgi:RNA polymerase sigma-54 factor